MCIGRLISLSTEQLQNHFKYEEFFIYLPNSPRDKTHEMSSISLEGKKKKPDQPAMEESQT